jgi:hypothetical protein
MWLTLKTEHSPKLTSERRAAAPPWSGDARFRAVCAICSVETCHCHVFPGPPRSPAGCLSLDVPTDPLLCGHVAVLSRCTGLDHRARSRTRFRITSTDCPWPKVVMHGVCCRRRARPTSTSLSGCRRDRSGSDFSPVTWRAVLPGPGDCPAFTGVVIGALAPL